ncbi:MAG: T9SS type A sorting domain-containing protein, partial [Ignavibacteriae bacterium]|nr:T9SS type A sorting domain-containing protein [Ignavibacteriota bacterium]
KIGYRLSFDTPKGQFINVNGSRVAEIMFEGEINKWLEASLFVDLIDGENTIEIEPSWGWMDVDYIAVPIGVITSVNENIKIPQMFTLEQNYPNPFNPTTKIRYSVPSITANSIPIIQLKIFDVLGREVKTLVNEAAKPGNYEVSFNASELSSGIYFYTLKAGDLYLTNKMNFIK